MENNSAASVYYSGRFGFYAFYDTPVTTQEQAIKVALIVPIDEEPQGYEYGTLPENQRVYVSGELKLEESCLLESGSVCAPIDHPVRIVNVKVSGDTPLCGPSERP